MLRRSSSLIVCASLSCAQGSGVSSAAIDAGHDARKMPTTDAMRMDSSRIDGGADAPTDGKDGGVGEGGEGGEADGSDSSSVGPDARTVDSGPGSLQYLCPIHFSESCMDGSLCESTCLGQFQDTPTCTWYAMNAVPTSAPCTAVSQITAVFSCAVELSTNCQNASLCESTCVGQLQAAATCSTFGMGGVATNVSCTDEVGQGSLPLYQCPVTASTGCTNTSLCETTCVGQISTLSTCTSRGPNAVATVASCTSLGDQTF